MADPLYTAYRLVRARRFADAIALYDRILSDTPDKPHVWVNRGVALQGLYRLEEAIESFEKALACQADYAAAHINRGVVLNWMGRYEEALADYDRALRLEPDSEPAHLGRSTVLSAMGRHHAAIADADYVLERNPGSGSAHYNKALVLLSLGNYAEGFREHEWRFGTDAILGRHRFPHPVWAGEKTRKRILVHCEQGLGDSIQFARYLPMLKGLDVVLEAPAALVRLFEQFGFQVIRRDDPLPPFDLHCPLMSLAAVFGTTLDTVPSRSRYIETPITAAGMLPLPPGPRVGIAWSSGVRPDQVIAVAMQKRKSIPRADIAPLLATPGIGFVSLQKDEPEDGIPDDLFSLMPACPDLAATALLIKFLDLVITVDSAVAHLAGALGKPVWVLNRYDICWRWLSGEKPSPWYESGRIYRQSAPNRWDDVIAQVKADLTREFACRSTQPAQAALSPARSTS